MSLRRSAAGLLLVASSVVACGHKGCRHKKGDAPSQAPTEDPVAVVASTRPDHPDPMERRDPNGPPRVAPKPNVGPTPNLPALPSLFAQDRHSHRPAPTPPAEYPCGAVWDGKKHYPLACVREFDRTRGTGERTARVIVPYEHMKAHVAALPRYVDHRADGTEGPVRAQLWAPMCTSFGTSSAIDHSVARWSGKSAHVSVMQVWARYHDTNLFDALAGSVGKTLAAEETWPFDPKVAWPWHKCPPHPKPNEKCGQPVDARRLAEADAKPVVVVEQVEWVPWNLELIRMKLAAGRDVVFAINMPYNARFAPTGEPGAMYVPHYDQSRPGHIMTIAGYYMLPRKDGGGAAGDNYYLLHNSFGEGWGDGGYAWIHEATLQRNNQGGFGVVDARLVSDGVGGHHARLRKSAKCKGDHAPDSQTGVCAKRCPDRSPRHNNVCPDPADCPKGFVNFTGVCVLAAPVGSGEEPSTHVRWECGPGGCVYSLPKGIGGPEPSVVSCPAPAFRAAKDHQGLTCVE